MNQRSGQRERSPDRRVVQPHAAHRQLIAEKHPVRSLADGVVDPENLRWRERCHSDCRVKFDADCRVHVTDQVAHAAHAGRQNNVFQRPTEFTVADDGHATVVEKPTRSSVVLPT